jgi:hypothetical protein
MGKRITHQEMYDNRLKAIAYLLTKKLKKTTGTLRNIGGGRCCLGHMMDALGVQCKLDNDDGYKYWFYFDKDQNDSSTLLDDVSEKLGTWDNNGSSNSDLGVLEYPGGSKIKYYNSITYVNVSCLTSLNDDTKWGPAKIGRYLLSVIMGGNATPFKPLNTRHVKRNFDLENSL